MTIKKSPSLLKRIFGASIDLFSIWIISLGSYIFLTFFFHNSIAEKLMCDESCVPGKSLFEISSYLYFIGLGTFFQKRTVGAFITKTEVINKEKKAGKGQLFFRQFLVSFLYVSIPLILLYRYFFTGFFLVICLYFLYFLIYLFDKQRRFPQDLLAGTQVVLQP